MKHLFTVVIVLLLVLSRAACAKAMKGDDDTQTLRVFIFAGQSNMEGADSNVDDIQRFPPFVGLDKPQDKVLFSYSKCCSPTVLGGKKSAIQGGGSLCSRWEVGSGRSLALPGEL